MKRRNAFIRFELDGRTRTYTGTPNKDELDEEPWGTAQLQAIIEDWFRMRIGISTRS